MRSTVLDTSLDTLDELSRVVTSLGHVYIRYSEGPDADRAGSVDTESGLQLPGLSVNPLHAESWWTRPFEDWLARQVCQYQHLHQKDPDRFAWVLTGVEVGCGPDCEPLLREVAPVARLSHDLLTEASARYRERFRAGHGPAESE